MFWHISEFDDSEFSLHDCSSLYQHLERNPDLEQVDKVAYLTTIKNCRWFGPYKDGEKKLPILLD